MIAIMIITKYKKYLIIKLMIKDNSYNNFKNFDFVCNVYFIEISVR